MHYYSFNIGDYASHTRHLEPLEDLAYRRILDLYYLHEQPLNECSTTVARLINMRKNVKEVELVLNEFFLLVKGVGWTNPRADDEIAKYHSKLESASKAGKASAQRRANDRSTDVQLNKKQEPRTSKQEPDKKQSRATRSVSVISNSDFEKFWEIYGKKVGKAESEMVWNKLNLDAETVSKIHAAATAYRVACPDKQFRKDPARWLNKRCWNDEIVVRNENSTPNQPQLTHHQATKLAASRMIFGDERTIQNERIIDITPVSAASAQLGAKDF